MIRVLLALVAAMSAATNGLARPQEPDVVAEAERLVETITLARDREHREPAWTALVALARTHDEVRPILTQGLTSFFERANRRMNNRSTRRAFAGLVEDRERLDELRLLTLALVRDETDYPYPYEQPDASAKQARAYRNSQRSIDANVLVMRVMWRDGAEARLTRELRKGGERVLWARDKADWLRDNLHLSVALEAPDVPTWMHSLPIERKDRKVNLRTFALTPEEAARVARDLDVVERNRELFDALRKDASGVDGRARVDLERDQVARTNEYRRMFGLSALAWNLRLHRAVRNHADYLARVGVLGHEQDTAEYSTFQKRAEAFGYVGPVWENCHSGSGTAIGALKAWTHSSAHHRTILTARLTEMATGHAGIVWVQKFGLDTAFESEIQCHPWRD